ncbi:hypothetical protein LTR37_005837 [Vermiconidia calcicola]|uniref:Uncharacterized protein n=1 Tax=Vermiconidia calcicola TaxID=1690605 RepID=A0ACC3NIH7_9PEZI|nr:hypothetical protein LTR37_005837 [Vermiconidia calcicola]
MVRKGTHTEEVLDQVLLDRSRFDIPKGDNWGKDFAKTEVLHYICESARPSANVRQSVSYSLRPSSYLTVPEHSAVTGPVQYSLDSSKLVLLNRWLFPKYASDRLQSQL